MIVLLCNFVEIYCCKSKGRCMILEFAFLLAIGWRSDWIMKKEIGTT